MQIYGKCIPLEKGLQGGRCVVYTTCHAPMKKTLDTVLLCKVYSHITIFLNNYIGGCVAFTA